MRLYRCFRSLKLIKNRVQSNLLPFLKTNYLFLVVIVLLSGLLYYERVRNHQQLLRILPLFQHSLIYMKDNSGLSSDDTVDKWQHIGDKTHRYQVYSAYFDSRPEVLLENGGLSDKYPYGSFRIIAIMPRHVRKNEISCNFRYSKLDIKKVLAQVSEIHEHHSKKFSAFFIVCTLTSDKWDEVALPHHVAITYDGEASMRDPSTWTRIHYPNGDGPIKNHDRNVGIAVCSAPMHNRFDEPLQTVEFVELYQILGVDHFYFYNSSMSPTVDQILTTYKHTGVATVLPWNLEGYASESELHYGGIMAALNDCLYRALVVDNFKYLLIVDIDEILMPLKTHKLINLLESQDHFDNANSFVFRNVFFFYGHQGNYQAISSEAKNKFLFTQVQTRRTKPLASHVRSKYIATVAKVVELGNHFVWNTVLGSKECVLDTSDALLFHYRRQCVLDACKEESVEDTRAHRFGEQLWRSVDGVCGALFVNGECPFE